MRSTDLRMLLSSSRTARSPHYRASTEIHFAPLTFRKLRVDVGGAVRGAAGISIVRACVGSSCGRRAHP